MVNKISIMNGSLDVICNGCKQEFSGPLDRVLEWARDHHNVLDHEPYKPSTQPDVHNIFQAINPDGQHFEVSASSMFVRVWSDRKMVDFKQFLTETRRERNL